MPETPCLFGNQTAVFLKCAEIDCALESAKKPRTAGLCGRAAGACDCGPLSCSTIEWVNKGRKPPKRDRIGRKNTLEKAHFSEIGVVLKRYFHTSPTNAATFASRDCGGYTRHPIPQTRTQRLTRRNRGRFGWGRYHYPRSVLRGSETLRGRDLKRQTLPLLGLGRGYSRRTQKACGTAMRLCVSLSRGVAAPLGCVIFFASAEIAVCTSCAQAFCVCEAWVVSLPSARFTCC